MFANVRVSSCYGCLVCSMWTNCREELIALSILRLIEMEKAVVEGAGAVGLAAVLGNLVPEFQGKK